MAYIPNALHSGNAHQDETAKTILREARAERWRKCPQRGKCPLTGIYGRDFSPPPIPPRQTRIFKAFQASLRKFNPFQACVMVTVFRIFLHDSLPIL
ncbi:hypothetical protein CXT87_11190 [Akkermansia muciniphila]|nr:hypothetical protein CXT93_08970 [Akkermansia muciniphila]PNC95860.1 hypothetical protein CXT87_11190 [Akkermansia muciniphila]PND06479.1 hypothetical protein CXT86_03825 [Akkermansia muciniphila]PND09510.1 hypothetical protein CXT85_08375 [Akkermansia muciniphila]